MSYDQTSFDLELVGMILDGRFEIVQPIGGGGMGSVFLGRQLSVDRDVAIKVLRPGLPESSRSRFLREARSVSAMSHPGIVQIIDHGESEGIAYIVMEMVKGVSLQDLLHDGRIHPHFAMEVVDQVCAALSEAHRHGVIHRDLKPSNIVMTRDVEGLPRAKLLDFGIAYSEHDPRLTQSGSLCGTPAYMAPEQAQGREVGPATDVYSLGIVLYQMLSGRLPFYSESPLGVLLKHLKEKAPPLDAHARAGVLPESLVALAAHMMKKQVENRPESPRAVRETIATIRHDVALGTLREEETPDIEFTRWVLPRLTADPRRDASTSPEVRFEPTTPEDYAVSTHPRSDTLAMPSTDEMEAFKPTEKFVAVDPDETPDTATERANSAPDEASARAWAAFAEASDSAPEQHAPEQIDPNLWDLQDDDVAAFSSSSIEFQVPARFYAIEPQDTGSRPAMTNAADVTAGMVPTAAKESITQKNDPKLSAEAPPPSYELEEVERPRTQAPPERAKVPELARRQTASSAFMSNIIFIVLLVGLVASMAFIGMEVFVNKPNREQQQTNAPSPEYEQYPGGESEEVEEDEVESEPADRAGEEDDGTSSKKTKRSGRKKRPPADKRGKAVEELPWRNPIDLYESGELEERSKKSLEKLD